MNASFSRNDVDVVDELIRPRVLLLCSQPSLTCSALYCLRGMGVDVVAAGDSGLHFLRFSRACETFVGCQVAHSDPNEFLARISDLVAEYQIDIVAPGDNDSLLLLAEVKDRLETPVFPIPTSQELADLNDKAVFYETCANIGVPVPDSVFVDDKHGLNPELLNERLGYPLIVKPTRWGGSEGLVVAESPEDLRQRVIENDDYCFQPLVAQELVPGRDVGLNVFAVDGETLLVSPQVREGDTVTQLDVTQSDNDRLVSFGRTYVEATGLTGLANLDARLGPEGQLHFLECNPRIWATICHSYWCGENYVAAGVRYALGLPPATPEQISGRSVTSPAHLLSDLARGRRTPRSLNRYERRALTEGVTDPVLLFRRYFEHFAKRTQRLGAYGELAG
jgi:predicted ATP-grasp superfamily ATP-dependent carboligase